jgi:alkanesulfonate monooxygenase SsuD/methylene tetrahydromethanopterin reductase-like flavin-dependent oxidoreductase (luciferase family)
MHVAVALQDAGWHPAAGLEPGARAEELFTAAYWVDQVREAARGLLDFVTLADSVTLQPEGGVRGRLDAMLVASAVAPLTDGIGIVPSIDTVVTEPFLVSTQVATLDFVSRGRAGWEASVPSTALDGYVGPRAITAIAERYAEAEEYVEVVRRLWDSWEDGAEIRDAARQRFFDAGRVHRIGFEGDYFSVVGPSITPRPPQAQPLVTARVDGPASAAFARRAADVAFVAGGPLEDVISFRDVVVFLDSSRGAASERRARLDALHPRPGEAFVGTPAELAERLLDEGGNVRLHPATHAHDLPAITRRLVPELQARGAFRTAYEAPTLRGLLGLPRPSNRYARA